MAVTPYYVHGTNLRDREFFTSTVQTNTGMTKRYFSSIEAEIHFGDILMDDIVSFDFALQETYLPIYGFNSFVANVRVRGRKEISGTFAINFTEAGYINKVLNSIQDSTYKTPMDNMATICDDKSAPQFNKQFDIILGYGYYKVDGLETLNNTHQILAGVEIIGVQSVVDVSGNPIMEVYQFVAKDLLHDNRDPASVVKNKPAFQKFNDTMMVNETNDDGFKGSVPHSDINVGAKQQASTGASQTAKTVPTASAKNNPVTVTRPGGNPNMVAGANAYNPNSRVSSTTPSSAAVASGALPTGVKVGLSDSWNSDEEQKSYAVRDLYSLYRLCHKSDAQKLQQFRTYRTTHQETILYVASTRLETNRLTIELNSECIASSAAFAMEIESASIEFSDDRIVNVPILPLTIKRTSRSSVLLTYNFTSSYNSVYQRLLYFYNMASQSAPYVCKIAFDVKSDSFNFSVSENLAIRK